MIRYLHRNLIIEEADVPADLSLLDYLRDNRGIKASKEGCASGDCGACTVALGYVNADSKLEYRSVNACICPASELQGADLITAGDLETAEGLHPLQQAFVTEHASQCGFCTPGFIVSGFTLLEHVNSPSLDQIKQAVAGNLCRCTGYGPIIKAIANTAPSYTSSIAKQQVLESLMSLKHSARHEQANETQAFMLPETLQQLGACMRSHPNAELIAGGTDLMLEITQQLKNKSSMISLSRIHALQKIETTDHQVVMGAGVSFNQMLHWANHYMPPLAHLLIHIGSDQIRNRGTLGGNLGTASPIGDLAPVLLALDARIHLWHPEGSRSMPLDSYFLGYRKTALKVGEIIHSLEFKLPQVSDLWVIDKVSKRVEDDISAICMALWARSNEGVIVDFRLGLGGVAATPIRATDIENGIIGQTLGSIKHADLESLVKDSITPLDDLRATAAYRIHCTSALLFEGLKQLGPSKETSNEC